MESIKRNFIYNCTYQILVLILPLITIPYLARVLGAEGQGIYSYTYSIVQIFILFAVLGINNYGSRKIAQCRENKEQLSKEFFSIYTIQVFITMIMLIIYLLYIYLFQNEYLKIFCIQSLFLIANFLDLNWFFQGLEKFKVVVLKNALIKIISIVAIFIFVKKEEDVTIYVLIMSASTFLSQIVMLPHLKGKINLIKPSWKDIKLHIKPILILFIPVIAVNVYKSVDRIILGNLVNMDEVGFYDYANKIVGVPLIIITSLGNVMLPRIANFAKKGKEKEIDKYFNIVIKFVMFLAIPAWLGIMAISENFITIFLGEGYIKTAYIIKYLSIVIVFISIANVIRTQYLLPLEKDKDYCISVILGAIVNVICNIILIPKKQSIGAAISIVITEFTVMTYQIYVMNKKENLRKYCKDIIWFFISGIVMCFIVTKLGKIIENKMLLTTLQILVGGLIYACLNYKYIFQMIRGERLS